MTLTGGALVVKHYVHGESERHARVTCGGAVTLALGFVVRWRRLRFLDGFAVGMS